MNKAKDRRIRKFNPGTFQPDSEVIEQFVIRKHELSTVLDILRGNIESPSCQHVLVVAPRGRGKTMLLARTAAELRVNDDFSENLLPVRFMEESQEIFNLADFWLDTLFYLSKECARPDSELAEAELAQELLQRHVALSAKWRDQGLENYARAAVLYAVDRLGRKLVLMVENFQALSKDVDEDFGWKLRAILQTEPQIMLVASATSRFEGLDDATQPFFEQFRILNLKPLNTDECRKLWEVVSGDTVSGREMRPLEILTGGSPRLLVIIAGFRRHKSMRHLMEELVHLIDEHTEYFRGHLDELPSHERRIYLAVIDLWRPSTPSEIGVRARMDVRTVSTMLGRLIRRGVVTVEGGGRKRRYTAAERLYCIYYKLRRERSEAAVVTNLIHFMAAFYNEAEQKEVFSALVLEAAESVAIRDGLDRAVAESPEINGILARMYRPSLEHSQLKKKELSVEGHTQSESVSTRDEKFLRRLNTEILDGLEKNEFEKVIGIVDQALASQRSDSYELPESFLAWTLLVKADAQEKLGDLVAAVLTYEEVVKRFGTAENPDMQMMIASALNSKGKILQGQGELDSAVLTYEEVVKRFGTAESPELQIKVAVAICDQGLALDMSGDPNSAVSTFGKAVEHIDSIETTELSDAIATALQGFVAAVLNTRGLVLQRQGELDSAVSTFEEVVMRFGTAENPDLQMVIASALAKKGEILQDQGELDSAVSTFEEVVDRFGTAENPDLQMVIASALAKKGEILQGQGELDSAVSTFEEVVMRFGTAENPDLQMVIASALAKKGEILQDQGELDSAVSTFEEVVDRFGTAENPDLQMALIASALAKKGEILQGQGELDSAVSTFEEVVMRFGTAENPDLQMVIASALAKKGEILQDQGELDSAVSTFEEVVDRFGTAENPYLHIKVALAISYKGWALNKSGDPSSAVSTFGKAVEHIDSIETAEFNDAVAHMLQRFVAVVLNMKGLVLQDQGELDSAVSTFEEIIKRFGTLESPELQILVARALISKTDLQTKMGLVENALETYDKLKRRISVLNVEGKNELTSQAMRVGTRMLLAQGDLHAAIDPFRMLYEVFEPDNETMMRELVELVIEMIAAGSAANDLLEILSSNAASEAALLPLIIALRQEVGEMDRVPDEIREIAKDICERIREKTTVNVDECQ